MDIQVLNEIANPARQASLTQVISQVSANAQLKALKGNPAHAPENSAPPTSEDFPDPTQDPVTPDISSVARAASTYSAAIEGGLNSDELSAIQDLAGRIRTAVSDFLSRPGLEQAENAAGVVASNPEAVHDLTARVEQAVAETLGSPRVENEAIANVSPPNTDLPEKVPTLENLVSVERITHGAEPNNPVIAVSPAVVHLPANENTSVENPVAVENVPESSRGDFRVTAADRALQNAPAGENVQVETPVSRPVAVPQQEPVSRAETVAVHPQEVAVTAASPVLPNVPAGENVQVETPVSRPVAVPQQEPVSRPETFAVNPREVAVTDAGPELQNAQAQNIELGNPVTIPPTSAGQRQGSEASSAQTVNPEGAIAPPEGASTQTASGQPNPQPASSPQPGSAPPNDLFAQENSAVNPENIRNVNELVNSVVDNEFTSEAKKIFSEPKVIRTVADLADFILERLREIIANNQLQQQSPSIGETGIS